MVIAFFKNITGPQLLGLICSSVIPFLVLGPFIPDLIISLLSICFIIYTIKNKMFYIYNNKYFYAFILFWCVCVISSFFAENLLFSLKSSFFYIRIGIFSLLISYLIDLDKKILNYFYYSLAIVFTILIIDGLIQYTTGVNITGNAIFRNRVSSFFKDELILGSYLSKLFPLFFALFLIRENKSKIELTAFLILFFLVFFTIFISGERAATALFFLWTIFIFVTFTKYKLIRSFVLLASICIFFFIVNNNSFLYKRYIIDPVKKMRFHDSNSKKLIFSPSHDFLIRTSFNMFLDKPIIGHGTKMFRIKCKDYRYKETSPRILCENHPHNFYAQLLAETGILGFLILFSFFIYIINLVFRHIYRLIFYKQSFLTNYQICLLGGLLITLWPLTTTGNLFNNNLMMLYGLQIGFFKRF